MDTRTVRVWTALVLLLIVSACAGGEEAIESTTPSEASTSSTTTSEGNLGGFGSPSNQGEFALQEYSPAISGSLWLASDGCWYSDINGSRRLVVLPSGFTLNPEDGGSLLGPEAVTYRSGDRFDATGVVIPFGEIPGSPDGRWASYATFCSPELEELVVFSTFTQAYDPGDVSHDDIAHMLTSAAFTEAWPCGRGWAASTSDQRLAIVVYEAAVTQTDLEVIELPDSDWIAEVLVGKNLFSEHCNDAIEPWIALPTIAVRLPLTAGTVTILDQLPGLSDPPAPVGAVIAHARVDLGSTPIELPTVELHNRSFNFFAG